MPSRKNLALFTFLLLLIAAGPSFSMTPWNDQAASMSQDENLASLLKEQKLTWSELQSIEDKKNAVLTRIDEILRDKNETILSYQKITHALEKKLKNQSLSFKDKLVGEYEKRELASIIEAKSERISDLEGQIMKLDLQVEGMKKQFTRQDTHFRYQLTRLKKNYQEVFEKLSQGVAPLPEGMAMKLSSYQIQLEKFLDTGLSPAPDTSAAELEKRLQAQEQTVQGLLKTNRDLASEIRKVEDENATLKREIGSLHEEVAMAKQESASWQRLAQELEIGLEKAERKLQIAKVDFEGEKANLVAQFEDLQQVESSLTRSPASTTQTSTSLSYNELTKAYQKVTSKLLNAQFEWAPVVESGMIAFKVKESFYFDKGSYVLTEMSKDRLHTLMEIYSQEIFGNEELSEKIESIEFIGHSSPWYQGEVVEPTLKYPEAFDYNMKLSMERAREVVTYVFDGDFIDFPHKEEFRSKIKISGQGHASPLMLRAPASESNIQCSPYDCERSRRLDIVVHFRSDAP